MTIEERAREERRAYYRQWRAKHRDKVRESNRKYWERRALKKAERESEANP